MAAKENIGSARTNDDVSSPHQEITNVALEGMSVPTAIDSQSEAMSATTDSTISYARRSPLAQHTSASLVYSTDFLRRESSPTSIIETMADSYEVEDLRNEIELERKVYLARMENRIRKKELIDCQRRINEVIPELEKYVASSGLGKSQVAKINSHLEVLNEIMAQSKFMDQTEGPPEIPLRFFDNSEI